MFFKEVSHALRYLNINSKYYYNLKQMYSILIYFKMYSCEGEAEFSPVITSL